jgi:hypothetical protein
VQIARWQFVAKNGEDYTTVGGGAAWRSEKNRPVPFERRRRFDVARVSGQLRSN